MHPFMLPWVASWCFCLNLMLPTTSQPQAEIIDLAEWRRLKRRA